MRDRYQSLFAISWPAGAEMNKRLVFSTKKTITIIENENNTLLEALDSASVQSLEWTTRTGSLKRFDACHLTLGHMLHSG
jgi:hypothetical protein